jgi:transposase InsO family protein
MVSPDSRRRAACHLLERGFPRACACRCAGISRNASRKAPEARPDSLREDVLRLSKENPCYGYRRVHFLLKGVNLKAVRRVWRHEGLRLNRRSRRRMRVPKMPSLELTAMNQAWCMDFLHERLENGRAYRVLAVLDCFTRECLLLKAEVHYPGSAVQRDLEWLIMVHGQPQRITSDNGPEFRSLKLPEGVESAFIQPGSPWQNGKVESFFDKLRDELLNREVFTCGEEVQTALDEHMDYYNQRRPHRSLKGQTPLAFKASTTNAQQEEKLTL